MSPPTLGTGGWSHWTQEQDIVVNLARLTLASMDQEKLATWMKIVKFIPVLFSV